MAGLISGCFICMCWLVIIPFILLVFGLGFMIVSEHPAFMFVGVPFIILLWMRGASRPRPAPRPQVVAGTLQAPAVPFHVPAAVTAPLPHPVSQRPGKASQKEESCITYRPKPPAMARFKIKNPDAVGAESLEDIHDAFTGQLIDRNASLFRCVRCKVFYQAQSVRVLREMNGSRCVSCSSTEIVDFRARAPATAPLNWKEVTGSGQAVTTPVTLDTYRGHVGQVIIFEGFVHRVNVSRDGRSYAVMFEDQPWSRGMKMTVFKGRVRTTGGSQFLKDLEGRVIRVKGRLAFHEDFGFEITVSSREMILDIR